MRMNESNERLLLLGKKERDDEQTSCSMKERDGIKLKTQTTNGKQKKAYRKQLP